MIVHLLYSPDAWVVSPEPHHKVSLRICHKGVPTHWYGGEVGVVVRIVEASVRFGSPDDLKVMSVQMEWVFACIVIVKYDFNNLALLENESVGIAAIDYRIHSSVTGGKSRIQGRDLRRDVGYVVEEGTSFYLACPHHGLLEIWGLTNLRRLQGYPSSGRD